MTPCSSCWTLNSTRSSAMFDFEHASSQGGREITNACVFVVRHHVCLWNNGKVRNLSLGAWFWIDRVCLEWNCILLLNSTFFLWNASVMEQFRVVEEDAMTQAVWKEVRVGKCSYFGAEFGARRYFSLQSPTGEWLGFLLKWSNVVLTCPFKAKFYVSL